MEPAPLHCTILWAWRLMFFDCLYYVGSASPSTNPTIVCLVTSSTCARRVLQSKAVCSTWLTTIHHPFYINLYYILMQTCLPVASRWWPPAGAGIVLQGPHRWVMSGGEGQHPGVVSSLLMLRLVFCWYYLMKLPLTLTIKYQKPRHVTICVYSTWLCLYFMEIENIHKPGLWHQVTQNHACTHTQSPSAHTRPDHDVGNYRGMCKYHPSSEFIYQICKHTYNTHSHMHIQSVYKGRQDR